MNQFLFNIVLHYAYYQFRLQTPIPSDQESSIKDVGGWVGEKGTIMLHLPTYIHCSLSPMVHIQYACISCYFVICWPALADSQLRIHYVDVLKMLRLLTLEPQLTHQMVCCRTTWSCDLTNKSASTSNPWCCARLFFKGSKSNLTIPYRKQNRCLHGKMVTSTDFLSLIYY